MFGFCVLTTSDRCADGTMKDISGEIAVKLLLNYGFLLVEKKIVPDDFKKITSTLEKWSLRDEINFIVTTGGTGLSDRDVTPQATLSLLEYQITGIVDYVRLKSAESNKKSILSRSVAGVKNHTLIINTPGSPSGVVDTLENILDVINHSLNVLINSTNEHN
ncbi:MAG: molybdenum cofactor biosynthesis protein [Chloroflexi bacterium]|nr:molybdenum cofactor biosynthesis protein [Chloroflexota bacterium]|tara:strand:+ start:79755 stop:80240 length:486 start_codon:yes stop_codon:yes gene_type:complete